MKLAKFVNFTDDIFAHPSLGGHDEICQWGREPYCFPAKSSQVMEDWKAAFFSKHLTNRELLKTPQGESHTSPKMKNGEFYSSEDDAYFMEIFNKCYLPVEKEYSSEEKMKDAVLNEVETKVIKENESIVSKPTVWCEKCGSLGVRHKKGCPELLTPKKIVESEFEGL